MTNYEMYCYLRSKSVHQNDRNLAEVQDEKSIENVAWLELNFFWYSLQNHLFDAKKVIQSKWNCFLIQRMFELCWSRYAMSTFHAATTFGLKYAAQNMYRAEGYELHLLLNFRVFYSWLFSIYSSAVLLKISKVLIRN